MTTAAVKKAVKECSSCGAKGHSRVTYKGCINYGKPKTEWKKANEASDVGAAAVKKAVKECSSCGAKGHSRVTYKGCINYGKPQTEWKKANEASDVGAPLPASTTVPPSAPPTPTITKRINSKTKEKWIRSKAKEMLRTEIIEGTVTNKSNPSTVHKSNKEYNKWPLANFKTNLKNLLEAVALDYQRMADDCEAYGHDIALLQDLRKDDPSDEPIPWHKSEAKAFLSQDIDAGKHESMIPSALWESRIAYMEFPLKTFRDHIYQELKRRADVESKARFKKKKNRLAPPSRADTVDEAALNLINEGQLHRGK
jgi:hypothetical protein